MHADAILRGRRTDDGGRATTDVIARYVEDRPRRLYRIGAPAPESVYFRAASGGRRCAFRGRSGADVRSPIARKAVALAAAALASWLHTSTHLPYSPGAPSGAVTNTNRRPRPCRIFHDATATAEWERLRPTIDGVDPRAERNRSRGGLAAVFRGPFVRRRRDAPRQRRRRAMRWSGRSTNCATPQRRGVTSTPRRWPPCWLIKLPRRPWRLLATITGSVI